MSAASALARACSSESDARPRLGVLALLALAAACAPAAGDAPGASGTAQGGSVALGGRTGGSAGRATSGQGGTATGGSASGTAGVTSLGGSGASDGGRGGMPTAGGGAPLTGGSAGAGRGGNPSNAGAAGQGGNSPSGGAGGTAGGDGAAIGGGAGSTRGGQGAGGSASGDPCAKPGVLLCDDFEKHGVGMQPAAPFTVVTNGLDGTVLIDGTTPAHSGTRSVHVQSLGNYQTFLAVSGAPVFPAPSPALYARTYLRLAAPMTSGHNTYFKAGAAGATSSNNETRVGVMVEMLMINQPDSDRGFLSNNNYWTDTLPGVVFTEQTWVCVEGFFDPPNSTVDIWVNEQEVPDLHRTDWKQDALGSFHFGFEKYAGPDADIWYDDIVIGTQPIGCR